MTDQQQNIDERAAWVERHLDRTLTDFQRRAVVLLCRAMRCGPWDFARTFETADWGFGRGISFNVERPQLATYDSDGLTTLVVGAHDEAIRVEICPATFRHLRIRMWPRQRERSEFHAHHPSIEHAVATCRRNLHAGRTPTDYALEFAEYLANGAERLLSRLNDVAAAEERSEDDDSQEAQEALEQALEAQGDAMSRLLSYVHEFRKRRDRAQEAAR